MTGHAAYSKEPCARPYNNTQEDCIHQARAIILTNTTSPYGDQPSSLARSSFDSTGSSSPGHRSWKPNDISPPDPTVVGWLSRNPFSLINPSTDERISQGEDDVPKTFQSISAEVVTETSEKIRLHAQGARHLGTRLDKFKHTSTPTLLCFLAVCLLTTIITYVQATYAAEERSNRGRPLSDLLKTDVSRMLTILRTSQGILTASVSLALENVFILLQWNQLRRPNGVSYLNVLALSPTTGALGILGLIKSSAPRLPTKLWALSRYDYLHISSKLCVSDLTI